MTRTGSPDALVAAAATEDDQTLTYQRVSCCLPRKNRTPQNLRPRQPRVPVNTADSALWPTSRSPGVPRKRKAPPKMAGPSVAKNRHGEHTNLSQGSVLSDPSLALWSVGTGPASLGAYCYTRISRCGGGHTAERMAGARAPDRITASTHLHTPGELLRSIQVKK